MTIAYYRLLLAVLPTDVPSLRASHRGQPAPKPGGRLFCRRVEAPHPGNNPAAARNYMAMMLLAVISLAIPSMFHNFVSADTIEHQQYINLAVAVVLLSTYCLSLVFMLKTHPEFFESTGQAGELSTEGRWSLARAFLDEYSSGHDVSHPGPGWLKMPNTKLRPLRKSQ